MWKLQLFKLNYDYREVSAVKNVVESGWLTLGEKTQKFESSFSSFLGRNTESIAVSNCTAALHMSLLALGIGPDDEVIIPALTFVADANSVMVTGAKPILADCSSLDDWNISVSTIKKALTRKTKAVIIVHYAGFPCNMTEIVSFCRSNDLYLIEDVAHAPGASIEGKMCGTWGDIGCFSFFSNKNLSIGEGGMVSTSDPSLSTRLRYLRSHGMSSLTLDRHKGRATSYDVIEPGFNYRIDEMRSALGLVQLDKLLEGNLKRKELFKRYQKNFVGSEILMPYSKLNDKVESAYHILPVLLPKGSDRRKIMESMKLKGIQTSIHYPSFCDFSAYKSQFVQDLIPLATEITSRELTLPLFPSMSKDEVDFASNSLLECLNEY